MWRDSQRVVCFRFRPFSCGKFVSNILSYNKHCLPEYDLQDEISISQYADVNYKHQIIMNTVPPADQLKYWRKYELRCANFYGMHPSQLEGNTNPADNFKPLIHLPSKSIIQSNLIDFMKRIKPKAKEILETTDYYTFVMAHQTHTCWILKEIFPKLNVINLVNDQIINEISKKIKSFSTSHTVESTLDPNAYNFDIGTIFNKQLFFEEITKLLTYLKVSDISLDDKVNEYYNRYMSIYKPYIEVIE